MALRKAYAYSKKKVTPYTRTSRRKGKAYVKVIPPQKIVKFTMGDQSGYEKGKYPLKLTMVTTEKAQVRHNALEACRQFINKNLDKILAGQYVFRVVPFPHHIQREHRMLTGAGADRMSAGMQLSFGKCMGKAAIVKDGSKLFIIAVQSQKGIKLARQLLKQIRPKLPCRTKILFEELSE
jgi:large subunit ribosomal protein L10e